MNDCFGALVGETETRGWHKRGAREGCFGVHFQLRCEVLEITPGETKESYLSVLVLILPVFCMRLYYGLCLLVRHWSRWSVILAK